MMTPTLLDDAAALLDLCRARQVKLATAESCTGGLIAAVLTAIDGSSDVVERGFITYSNEAKTELLGVPADLIAAVGAVSEPVTQRMATGALEHSHADIVVSVTGVAGPGGGSVEKPVGLIWFGLAQRGGEVVTERQVFPGDRTAIRVAAVKKAFALIRARLQPSAPPASVDAEELRDAFDFVSMGAPLEHSAVISLDTGRIYWLSRDGDLEEEPLPDDLDTSDRYIAVPHKTELDLGRRLVLRFVDRELPNDFDTVEGFFRRKGAYRRFKQLLESRGMLERWYEFENSATERALLEWCQENGIAPVGR
jgi:nicotinamide-nucleotide amidase